MQNKTASGLSHHTRMLFHTRQDFCTKIHFLKFMVGKSLGVMGQNEHCPVGLQRAPFCQIFSPKESCQVPFLLKSVPIIVVFRVIAINQTKSFTILYSVFERIYIRVRPRPDAGWLGELVALHSQRTPV
jgi:hypothetical protein